MTVDELVTQLQAIQARGGGKLQVAYPLTVGQPSRPPAPKVIYQLAVINIPTDTPSKRGRYVSLNPELEELDREVLQDQRLDSKP